MSPYGQGPAPANLADILERVLDKGVVIAGDIRVNLLDIELLTIKLRLLVASVDKAKEMGIDWWENDPSLSSGARGAVSPAGSGSAAGFGGGPAPGGGRAVAASPGPDGLAAENERLRAEIARLREGAPPPGGAAGDAGEGR
jgi:hypothetical protein